MAEPKATIQMDSAFKGMKSFGGSLAANLDYAALVVNLAASAPGELSARPGLRKVDGPTTDVSPPAIEYGAGLVGMPMPFLPFGYGGG